MKAEAFTKGNKWQVRDMETGRVALNYTKKQVQDMFPNAKTDFELKQKFKSWVKTLTL